VICLAPLGPGPNITLSILRVNLVLLTPFFTAQGFTWVICAASMDGLAQWWVGLFTQVPAQSGCDSYKCRFQEMASITISVSSFYYFIDKKWD
jgi:hypothetical protein